MFGFRRQSTDVGSTFGRQGDGRSGMPARPAVVAASLSRPGVDGLRRELHRGG